MDQLSYLEELMKIKPVYVADEQSYQCFNPPFVIFESRINSLQRNWMLNKKYLELHIWNLQRIPNSLILHYREKEAAFLLKKKQGEQTTLLEDEEFKMGWTDEELVMHFEETFAPDKDYIPEYVRGSTISLLISLLENLLSELSLVIASDLKIEVELPESKMPYINKYLSFFLKGCGLEFKLNKKQNKVLDAIREVRNRFIHNIDRDIPAHLQSIITEMSTTINNSESTINDQFVDNSMDEISRLVKDIEIAYIKFRITLPSKVLNDQQ